MSESASAAPPAPARPEGLFGALFGFIALALVFGLVVATLGLRLQDNDVSSLYAELLPDAEAEPLPLGLVHTGGAAMAGDQRSLVFERPSATTDPDPTEHWPVKAAFVRFSEALPARRLFMPVPMNLPRDLSKDLERWREKPYTFEAVTRRGTLTFGVHETDFLIVRKFAASGTFFDIVRVDLTVGRTGQYLEAHWPVEYEGASARTLVPLLERFVMPKLPTDAASAPG